MNIELLSALEELVKPGHTEWGGMKIAFSVARYFTRTQYGRHVPSRCDLGDIYQYNATACLVGFTLIAAGKGQLLLDRPEIDFKNANLAIEARHLLGLDDDVAFELFSGCLDEMTTGEQAARCVRGVVIHGQADWYMARKQ